MSFTVASCEQRSPEWFALRAGRVTSSCASDMLSEKKSAGETAARRNLRVRLALERITGKPLEAEGFVSKAMQDGIDREAEALAQYEAVTGTFVERTGFLVYDDLMAGASLDGHVGNIDGVVEAKCPTHAIHLGYLQTGKVPTDYLRQITHQVFVTGAKWADFLSYQPDFPEALRVKLVRVRRDELDLAAYELALRQFLREVDADVATIAGLKA